MDYARPHKPYEVCDTSHLRAAGTRQGSNGTAAGSLRWQQERPDTPTDIKKYRQSTLHTPGQIYRHFGAAADPVDSQRTYGKVSEEQTSAAACFKTYPESDMMRWTLDRAEDVYHSSAREPLGRGWVRGHKLPEGLGTERPFGQRVNAQENSAMSLARQAIAPVDADYEDGDEVGTAAHELYVRSHGAFAPGEQRRRPYDWETSGVDPAGFRFGAVDKADISNGVGKALNPDLDRELAKPSCLVKKAVEEHKLVSGDVLGQSRKLGAGDRGLPADFTFGKPSLPKEREDGVEKLLPGYYAAEDQEPDADLGRSLREGYRNVPAPGRTFGVPSVRIDLPPPRHLSVANTQNYGNEPNVMSLISPCTTADRGVNETHYLQRHDRSGVRTLLADAGIEMTDADFEAYFVASAASEGLVDKTCLKSFMDVRHATLQKTAGL